MADAILHRDQWLAGLNDAKSKWNARGTCTAKAAKAAKLTEDELIKLLKGHGQSTNTKGHGRGQHMNGDQLKDAWLAYTGHTTKKMRVR